MLDNLVGGGIGWGWSIEQTLIKECAEESGISEALARQSVAGRTIHVLAEIEEGTQAEQLFVYDLVLPPDFRPTAMDGEVAEHLEVSIDQTLLAVASGRMTVDASLASLDCALRRGWLSSADLPGFISLYTAPIPTIG
jgi:ADP-ribose pyrophosphatase YjhB (NUDIX family)